MLYLQLFFEFFKTGLFAVGGGLATLPFLYDISVKTGWFSTEDIMNLIAISESTPGPLGVNMATFAGVTTTGVLGGIVSTLGLIAPSIVIIEIIATILLKFKNSKIVQAAFTGLRPASTALIAVAGLLVAKVTLLNTSLYGESGKITDLFSIESIIFAVIIYICYKKFKKHPVIYIAVSAVVGIVLAL